MELLARDGFLYYVVMVGMSSYFEKISGQCLFLFMKVISIINLVSDVSLPSSRLILTALLVPAIRASCSILGSRIVLNLRGVACSVGDEGILLESIRFVEAPTRLSDRSVA